MLDINSRPRQIFFFSLSCLALFFLPYFFLGEESFINPIDNLDSNLVWYKVIADQGAHFWPNDQLVDGMIGLQPRHVYPSEFDPNLWLYTMFPTIWAYVLNFVLVHLIAFFSMYFLLRHHILMLNTEDWVKELYASGGALLFALIPFWVHSGISAAGIPLLLLGIIHLEKGHWRKGLLLSLCYVLYSSLIMSGVFVLALYLFYLMLGLVFQSVKLEKKKFHIINMAVMAFTYVITHYRLLQAVLFSDFESHRIQAATLDIESLALTSFFDFPFRAYVIDGQWHAGAMFALIPVSALALLSWALLKKQKHQMVRHIGVALLSLLVLLYFFSNGFINQLISSIPVIGALQWERFYVLLPFGLSIAFVSLYYWLIPAGKVKNLCFTFCVLASVLFYFTKDFNWNNNLKLLLGRTPHGQTYADYYQLEEYPKVKEALEEQGYKRVVSLGIDPAIAVFHGIRSADGYLANYQLSSKEQMRKVIAGELDKAPILKGYFDNWGSRCYFFQNEIGKDISKQIKLSIQSMDYDFEALEDLQVSHILSVYSVGLNEQLSEQLSLLETFKHKGRSYYIYQLLYL